MTEGELPPEAMREAREALLAHYDREARSLPWRHDTDPYRVLVSEVMLQQTRVDTVLGYYEPWLERFPSLGVLAAAGEDEVLRAWEGLGYYRRARNLHRAARVVREEWGGRLPSTATELKALPGIGEYTAGAVASIAFGEAVPAVDGNVRRVLSRLHDEPLPTAAWLRRRAALWVDRERPGDWNQALMELGATVCTPRRPRCPECPVALWCRARAAGTVADRPQAVPKRRPRSATFVVAVLHSAGRVLLEKRPAEGLLAGLWAFPEQAVASGPEGEVAGVVGGGAGGRAAGGANGDTTIGAARAIAARLKLHVAAHPEPLAPVRHRFTHIDATYLPVAMAVRGRGEPTIEGSPRRWVDPLDPGVAMPQAQRAILEAWFDTSGGASSE